MIVKSPKNKYERKIYKCCSALPDITEGEKASIYDLATQYIPNDAHIDFRLINIDNYIKDIVTIYDKHKSSSVINLINMYVKKNKKNKKNKSISNV